MLGRTGRTVFPVGLGAMPLSMGGRPDEAAAVATLHAAFDAGIDFVDTANVYCAGDDEIGHNERLIAKALSSWPGETITVAAKGGVDRRIRRVDASPWFLRQSCTDSLRALGCEAIFLYQLHAPDAEIPFEDSIGELARLQEEGKIAHIGLCNVSVAHLHAAQRIVRIESVQNACNPLDPEDYENGMLSACQDQGVSFVPHSVIGGAHHHHALARHPVLVDLAAKYRTTPYAVVIAWHLAQSDCVIPIPGASKPQTAAASASAASLYLEDDDIAAVSALSRAEESVGAAG
ncbi:MAG: aldo/keto reductase [Sphingomonas sp.]|nr:MAG: aldo/keto reductase [Sphingomonas sp.]